MHLQELMGDVEVIIYEWRIVNEYHAAWLQLLEQGRAAWGDASKKDKLWRLLVWSKPSLSIKPSAPNLAHQCMLNTPCSTSLQAMIALQSSVNLPVFVTTGQSQPISGHGAHVVADDATAPATHGCVSDRHDFATAMLGLFLAVTSYANAFVCGACLPVPTNLHLHE